MTSESFGIAIPNNSGDEYSESQFRTFFAMFGIHTNMFGIHPPGAPFGGFSRGIRVRYLVRFGLLCAGKARVPRFWCTTARYVRVCQKVDALFF